uniref:Pre-rRNA-processing protein TSR1 homolog n=1 Tax=Bursaphelenchus xylophilus TaxID=6326 RepID=A0A1I7SWN2_BURXY
MQAHRAGVFKQVHKSHRVGRHRTKREIHRDVKGKKITKKVNGAGAKLARIISNVDRKNQRKHWREFKNHLIQERARLEGGPNRAPQMVTVLCLDDELLATEVVDKLLKVDESAVITTSDRAGITFLNLPRFKSRFGFLCPNPKMLESLLDAVKVSDALLIVWPTDGEMTPEQMELLDILLAHGTASPVHVVAGLPPNGKQREQLRKQLEKKINKWMSSKRGISFLDSDSNSLNLLRHLSTLKKKTHQIRRPFLLVEQAELVDDESGIGTLKVTGYVRGPPLNVNRLVHIQGWGDFQIEKIVDGRDPRPLKRKYDPNSKPDVIAVADQALQESLQSEVVPDPMESEQPEIDENPQFDGVFKVPKLKRKVPAGMSEYQASWIIDNEDYDDDEEGEDDDDEDLDEEDESDDNDGDRLDKDMNPLEEDDEMDAASVGSAMNETISMAGIEDRPADEDEVRKFREENEDRKWPDQMECPMDQQARVRFQKYRGLKSFRTSPWDVKENLPIDYARIFKFACFSRTKRLVVKTQESDYSDQNANQVAKTGSYVTVYLKNVPSHILNEIDPRYPLALYGLLKHENKFSVMNVVLRKYNGCKIPIKNKESLVFHVGSRRFVVDPIFSEHSTGDKFKMERFMPEGTPFVASFYGPVTFGPCPVLVFKRDVDGNESFVAYGSVLNANPDRIVLKRIVLTGHPYKINKRSAVVRFMFFNKEDIDWFKPVELYTDNGHRGHIKDSIGTHGLMKCVFNLPLGKQDAVKMNLFKRVFPRWTFTPHFIQKKSVSPIVELPTGFSKDVEME